MSQTADRLVLLTRLGFAARGLLYVVIALLLLQAGRSEDPAGALAWLGGQGGKPLLWLMTAGLAAYGLWRVSDAALNLDGHDPGGKGVRQRIGAAASGAVHLLPAWQAMRFATADRAVPAGDGGSSGGAVGASRTALELPLGETMLLIAGLVLAGVGLFQFVKAYQCRFCEKIDGPAASQQWLRWLGRLGYSARGLVFVVTGYFLFRAARSHDASEAGGMEKALSWLDWPWDALVAAGLLAFGLFSLVEAALRRIRPVPLDRMANAIPGARF